MQSDPLFIALIPGVYCTNIVLLRSSLLCYIEIIFIMYICLQVEMCYTDVQNLFTFLFTSYLLLAFFYL
jgi:hypothetical protein